MKRSIYENVITLKRGSPNYAYNLRYAYTIDRSGDIFSIGYVIDEIDNSYGISSLSGLRRQ